MSSSTLLPLVAAVLYDRGTVTEYFAIVWDDISWLGVRVGLSKYQTLWEFLTLVLAAARWCPLFPAVLICGDNLASLNLAISGKSKGLLWGRRSRIGMAKSKV